MSIAQANAEDMQTYRTVTLLLRDMQMPPHIKGYGYIREGLMSVLDNPKMLNAITTKLYPTIAEKFDTTPTRVERGMRHCIELTHTKGNLEKWQEVLGPYKQLSNSLFLAVVAEYIKLG